jgi:hypothetical protein
MLSGHPGTRFVMPLRVDLQAVSSLLVAEADLALVRSIRGAIKAADDAVGSFASKPGPASYSPQPRPGDSVTLTPEVHYAARPVIHPTPRIEPRPVVHAGDRDPAIDPSIRSTDSTSSHLAQPLPPPWKDHSKIHAYACTPAKSDHTPLKITLRRVDTYHRGAMIDFFC